MRMKIINIKELFDGKALGIEFDSGQKCTSWNDKNNPERIRALLGVNVEPTLKPYVSKSGKTGINLVGIEVLEEGAVDTMPGKQIHVPANVKPEVFLKDDKIGALCLVKCAVELAKGFALKEGGRDIRENNEELGEFLCMAVVELHGAYKLALDRLK